MRANWWAILVASCLVSSSVWAQESRLVTTPSRLPQTPASRAFMAAGCRLVSITKTHTLPVRPTTSDPDKAGSSDAIITLVVTIGPDGIASDILVAESSGNTEIDKVAQDHVKSIWRWQPQTDPNCQLATTTRIVLRLEGSRPSQTPSR